MLDAIKHAAAQIAEKFREICRPSVRRWSIAGVGTFQKDRKYATRVDILRARTYRKDELREQEWAWTSEKAPLWRDNYYTVNLVTGEVRHAHVSTNRVHLELK